MTAGWRDSAACRGHDQNLWYPVRGGINAAALAGVNLTEIDRLVTGLA